MARTPEVSAADVGEQLARYSRVWVLRLLDMALEESRIDGLLKGPIVGAFGQEAVAVGTITALRPGDVISTAVRHLERDQQAGHTLPLGPAIAEIAPSRAAGTGVAEPPFAIEWKQIFATSNPMRRSILFALGDACAKQLAGAGNVTVCVIDGDAVDSAEFKSSAAIALSWRLPVVFVVESICAASGVRRGPRDRHGLPMVSVDGRNVGAVYDSVAQAVQRAGVGDGPTIVEAVTYRINDPTAVDPLVFARRQLNRAGVSAGYLYEVDTRARHLLSEAAAVANALLRAQCSAPVRGPDDRSAAN